MSDTIEALFDEKYLSYYSNDLMKLFNKLHTSTVGNSIERLYSLILGLKQKRSRISSAIQESQAALIVTVIASLLNEKDEVYLCTPVVVEALDVLFRSRLFEMEKQLPFNEPFSVRTERDYLLLSQSFDLLAKESPSLVSRFCLLDEFPLSGYRTLALWPVVFAHWVVSHKDLFPAFQNPPSKFAVGLKLQTPHVLPKSGGEVVEQSIIIRNYVASLLHGAENRGDDTLAENIRQQIFETVGHTSEYYVKNYCNPRLIEMYLINWFQGHWRQHVRCLDENTRNILISGDYVLLTLMQTEVVDWAAPAIQYCRAFEYELKRRIYIPRKQDYKMQSWSLGKIHYLYDLFSKHELKGDNKSNWNIIEERVSSSQANKKGFYEFAKLLHNENITGMRNELAHGNSVTQVTAEEIRRIILGDAEKPGLIWWVIKNLDTV